VVESRSRHGATEERPGRGLVEESRSWRGSVEESISQRGSAIDGVEIPMRSAWQYPGVTRRRRDLGAARRGEGVEISVRLTRRYPDSTKSRPRCDAVEEERSHLSRPRWPDISATLCSNQVDLPYPITILERRIFHRSNLGMNHDQIDLGLVSNGPTS
jgi:hypothetical protein